MEEEEEGILSPLLLFPYSSSYKSLVKTQLY
jgi:hypothetical protein